MEHPADTRICRETP